MYSGVTVVLTISWQIGFLVWDFEVSVSFSVYLSVLFPV